MGLCACVLVKYVNTLKSIHLNVPGTHVHVFKGVWEWKMHVCVHAAMCVKKGLETQ